MTLFLKRILRSRCALDENLSCLDLKRLFCLRGSDKRTLYNDCSANVELADLAEICHCVVVNNLKSLKIASVADNNKSKCLGITDTAHPSADGDLLVHVGFSVSVKFPNRN